MKASMYLVGIAAAAALLVSVQASATIINFENADTPAHGNLTDNDKVTNQWATNGVTFVGAYLEATGDGANDTKPQGFLNDKTGKYDDPYAATPGLGDWFIRSNGNIRGRGGKGVYLTINYATAVTAASGQIWDIDGHGKRSEQWRVEAFLNGVEVASVLSPKGTSVGHKSLNGLPWTFNLSYNGGFDQIKFDFIGGKTKNTGLAFDNFNTNSVSVPEPAELGLFGLGLVLVGLFAGLSRRRRRAD